MGNSDRKTTHVVAMPYPGRGHINPMMNLCKLLSSRKPGSLLITFVVTEEWLGYIGSDPKPHNVWFATIPNILPSERVRAADAPGFYEAVMRKMEAPFEQLLDRLQRPVDIIIGDVELRWPADVGNRRNIPVAAFWTSSARFFSMLYGFGVFISNRQLSIDFLDIGDNETVHIPGISSARLAELRTVLHRNNRRVMELALECVLKVSQCQYLLFTSVQELEEEEFNSLKALFPFAVYPFGPAIPYLELDEKTSGFPTGGDSLQYLRWLDSNPVGSVMYISLGSFLSISPSQMDKILDTLNNDGTRYFWVAREEATRLKEKCSDNGLIVPWCDQLKVLSHSSIGGFWSHCGWNSTLEAVFAGVPILTCPLCFDQVPSSSQIVLEWKNGKEVKREKAIDQVLLREEEISEIVRSFMDVENTIGEEIRKNARELRDMCRRAITKGGSSYTNLDAFLASICGHN